MNIWLRPVLKSILKKTKVLGFSIFGRGGLMDFIISQYRHD